MALGTKTGGFAFRESYQLDLMLKKFPDIQVVHVVGDLYLNDDEEII